MNLIRFLEDNCDMIAAIVCVVGVIVAMIASK
jgi:hypothetical protein